MAVRREQSEMFHLPFAKVADAVRSALADGQTTYRYDNTVEAEDGLVFHTVVRPSSEWLLSTRMAILVNPRASETEVTVQTRSQWFLLGDVFDFYGGYIRDMLRAIRRHQLEGNAGSRLEARVAELEKQVAGGAP